jgi:hypothetical protein
MQDETPRVDLGKRDDPVDHARNDEYLGAKRDGVSSFSGKLLIAAVLVMVVLAVFLVAGRSRHAPPPPPPATPVTTPVTLPESVQAAGEEISQAPQDAEPAAEPVDPLETARDKICRSIASEFVDTETPTQEQMRRTLTIYNLNECSNRYIRDKDAEGRGLDKAELEAIREQESVGPLRLEDK